MTNVSMHIPPIAAMHQMIPPEPEGEKKVASDIFVANITQNNVTVATKRLAIKVTVNDIKNSTNIIAPTMPVSPRIINGKTPFSIGADQSVIIP